MSYFHSILCQYTVCITPKLYYFLVCLKLMQTTKLNNNRLLLIYLFIQYPVMFYLATTMTVCTYMQPYKHAVSNILDSLLSANLLVLLIIRNTSALSFGEEQTFLLTEEPSVKLNDTHLTCSSQSTEKNMHITKRVYALAPFYFIPLLAFTLTVVALIIYIIVW